MVPFWVIVTDCPLGGLVAVPPRACRRELKPWPEPFGRVKLQFDALLVPVVRAPALTLSIGRPVPVLAEVMVSAALVVTGLTASNEPSRLPPTAPAKASTMSCVVSDPAAR